jgi:hypothetical protein
LPTITPFRGAGEVANSACGDPTGSEGKQVEDRTAVGRYDGGQNRWPIGGFTTVRWDIGNRRNFDGTPARKAIPASARAEPLDGPVPGEGQRRLASVSTAAIPCGQTSSKLNATAVSLRQRGMLFQSPAFPFPPPGANRGHTATRCARAGESAGQRQSRLWRLRPVRNQSPYLGLRPLAPGL